MKLLACIVATLLVATAGQATAAAGGRSSVCSSATPSQPLPSPSFDEGPTISPADLTSDFDGWLVGRAALNPDINLRADAEALSRAASEIRRTLNEPMSQRQAWARFSLLNPLLGDGHDGIYLPDYRGALADRVARGGRIVPVEVRFARDGSLRFYSNAARPDGPAPGDRIEAINGTSAQEMVDEMLRRAPGDSLQHRRAWVARRFAVLHAALYGETGEYDLVVRTPGARCARSFRLPVSRDIPLSLQSRPLATDLFEWKVLKGRVGYLRVDSFDPSYRKALADVAQGAFSEFRRRHIRALVIDVRENGGGDDPLWQQSLMEYISDRPYAHVSSYSIRVTPENADPGDVVGSVQRSTYRKRFTPTPDNPLRFTGPVYILTGPFSFSATIQFVVAAQDFGVASVAGDETAALSCQTGRIHPIPMPRTGLAAFTPTAAFVRPSGNGCRRGVMPDVRLPINEVSPDATLARLLKRIGG